MDRHRRTDTEVEGTGEARSIAGTLGLELKSTRRRRRLTQAQLGRRVGLSGARVGELERGDGASAPLEVWVKLGKAIGRAIAVAFTRDLDTSLVTPATSPPRNWFSDSLASTADVLTSSFRPAPRIPGSPSTSRSGTSPPGR